MYYDLTRKAFEDISLYLHQHENEIAISENDFGNLQYAFTEIVGRCPLSTQQYRELAASIIANHDKKADRLKLVVNQCVDKLNR